MKGDEVRAIERATRAELRKLPEPVRVSALARTAIDLAKRLDAEPADTTATLLARELRMTMADLHRRAPEDATSDVEDYLARIAATDERYTAD
jgi:hypothetical protein